VRIVEGVSGRVPMQMQLVMRFDYGRSVPWVQRQDGRLSAIAGPDALFLVTAAETRRAERATRASFTVDAGSRVPFVLAWHPSYERAPRAIDAFDALDQTTGWWEDWAARCTYDGGWHDAVMRSLLTLKALTYGPTGGIVAAATT